MTPHTFAYDGLNRLTNMVDAVGTARYTYDSVGQLLSEDGPWASDTVSYSFNHRLRSSLSLQAPNASAWMQTYGYDLAKRLTNITSPAGVFGYSYDSTRKIQVGKLSLPGGAYITNHYDSVARLLSTALKNSSHSTLNSHAYQLNLGNQRMRQTRTGGDYIDYTYDSSGQLKTANGTELGGVTRLHEQFSYEYDAAGNLSNRLSHGLSQTFNVNSLNQLTTVTRDGTMTVAGTTTSAPTDVTVNTSNAVVYSDATFASTNHPLTNGFNTFTAIAHDSYGRVDTNSVTVYLPATNTFVYDLNGNLRTDGTRTFDYDDENQLIRITQPGEWKAEFTYDGRFRRRTETNFTWQGGTWVATNAVRFIYDGNVVIQHRDGNNLPQLTFTRGLDLSGTFQGAGGIGGLLAMTENPLAINHQPSTSYYHCDGNGNITCLINTNQAVVVRYHYDPFGNTLSISGPKAFLNPYRFSSKPIHELSGMYDYLRRWYDPTIQRWLNTDPVGNPGFRRHGLNRKSRPSLQTQQNLYRFTNNDPTGGVDPDGLDVYKIHISADISTGGSSVNHREIVGDDGKGGVFVLSFDKDPCCGISILGASIYGKGKVTLTRQPNISAEGWIKENAASVKKRIVTPHTDVDKAVSGIADAYGNWKPTYVLGFYDCGSVANKFIADAEQAVRRWDEKEFSDEPLK